nr:hypothetical protein [Oculatella sp. FACHB-28]
MYSRHRFPGEIISYCVCLYYTFPLSYRDIEKMMLYRGIEVTYETIRIMVSEIWAAIRQRASAQTTLPHR